VSGKDEGQDLANRKLTLPCIYAISDKTSRDEFLSLWNEAKPDAARIAKFLKDRGHIQKTRDKGREIIDSMLAMIEKLPCKAEAAELAFFVQIMAKREF
jgi:geranylgeranyl pyrophosphate synthase